MATLNMAQTSDFMELKCDICDSTNVKETQEGYACGDCGIVLEIQKLAYYRPYNDDALQHAVLGNTQIGSKRERLRSTNSVTLEKLNKLQSIKDNEQVVLENARYEISRLFNSLNLPSSSKSMVLSKLKKIRAGLRPGTKYRNPDKLAPIAIYFCMKLHNISINENELLEISKITKKEFNAFKLQITSFIPEYSERNRKDYILQKILEISEHFNLGMVFYYQSKKMLYKLWSLINCTKDDVIAGVIASINSLCFYKESVTVNAICNRLGIKMSTIQSQVKKKIFEKFKISGFISLVKSSELLKEVLKKLAIYSSNQPIDISTDNTDLIEIKLGNASNIFNANDNIGYYIYAMKDSNEFPLFISLRLHDIHDSVVNSRKKGKYENPGQSLFDFELLRFYPPKGPP